MPLLINQPRKTQSAWNKKTAFADRCAARRINRETHIGEVSAITLLLAEAMRLRDLPPPRHRLTKNHRGMVIYAMELAGAYLNTLPAAERLRRWKELVGPPEPKPTRAIMEKGLWYERMDGKVVGPAQGYGPGTFVIDGIIYNLSGQARGAMGPGYDLRCTCDPPAPYMLLWAQAHPDHRWIARDPDGGWRSYSHTPKIVPGREGWCVDKGDVLNIRYDDGHPAPTPTWHTTVQRIPRSLEVTRG